MISDNFDGFNLVNPDPGAMIESLRAFGYSIEASIADIIDNSIAAGAHNVEIQFTWLGEHSTISILDDGCGMGEGKLINAMRPGSKNPLEARNAGDLGRFGLGMKTASFSQCRRLTVGSKAAGNDLVIRRWDLDYVNKCGEWRLQKVDAGHTGRVFSCLDNLDSGTIVLWENIDRLVSGKSQDIPEHENQFYEYVDKVRDHISMVFHRFLENQKELKITVNNRHLKPWDPFLKTHPSTQFLSEEPLYHKMIKIPVRPFILPHRSKMNDRTYEDAGGPGGWNARQGFYIYRNRRLIVAGGWLGLGFRKEPQNKLARILVDIPNSMDDDWKIDVKKSVARPPDCLRKDFKNIARLTVDRATAVYRHRGKIVARQNAGDFVFTWNTNLKDGFYYYTVNRKHPLVADVLEHSGNNIRKTEAMLRLIEETVPVPNIILNNSEKPDNLHSPFEGCPSKELLDVLIEIWFSMTQSGIPQSEAKKRIFSMEPFCDYPEHVASFLESIGEKI